MTIKRMIELLAFERKCVESADECDHNCAECNLVQDTNELLDMYNEVILLLKAQEPEAVDAPKPDSDIGCWYDITHNYTLEQVVSALKAQEPPTSESISSAIECLLHPQDADDSDMAKAIDTAVRAMRLLKAQKPITGETSDGYHTFNELYHHRAVLFSVIVANYPDRAWKSKKHHDGTMYDNMFIVGINTPDGQATYHYYIEPYWDMFDCKILDNAPEWDGHTPAEAIERIGKLKAMR